MSIIHDALKRVQQGLKPKVEETPAPAPSGTSNKGSSYIYATPPAAEVITQDGQKTSKPKPPVKKKIESVFVTTCVVLITMAITIASIDYILQQFQTDIPKVQRLAQKSISKLIHKKTLPPKLTSMAQLTINPPAGPQSTTAPAAITLDIHGIMSNGNGNLVLINDQVYQAGDEVDGAKIIKIDMDSVTVDINGTQKTIFVKD